MGSGKAGLTGLLSLWLALAAGLFAQTAIPSSAEELATALVAVPDEAGRNSLLTTHAAFVNEALADRLAELGKQNAEQNRFDQALSAFQASQQVAEKLSYAKGMMAAFSGIGGAQSGRSEFKAALATYTQLLALAERNGVRSSQASAHSNLVLVGVGQ
jgi:tetratricopeptide (TPR) repeat protein